MAGRRRELAAVAAEGAPNRSGLVGKVAETVEKLSLAPEDVAVAELALRYAQTIDRAAAIAADAARVPFDPDTVEAVEQLRKRVSAQTTMADLGPKLLAALDALGATPKARAAKGTPAHAAGSSRLAALRSDPA